MKFISILLICFLFINCSKSKTEQYKDKVSFLKAKIFQTNDMSCGWPLLDFSEDSVRIRAFTNLSNLTYIVINLPKNYIIQDKKIYVSVTALKPEEAFFFTDDGVPHPSLKVYRCKRKKLIAA